MNVKGQAKRWTRLLITTGVVFLIGCVTLESPETKYVLTSEGFKEIDKPAAQANAETVQPVITDMASKPVSGQPQSSSDWTANQAGAWGFCCRQGRGVEPEPMSAFEFTYPLDVDTAYLRIKREFGFLSREDLSRKPIVLNYMEEKRLFHLRYEATPGVHYKMRNFVAHPYGNEEPSNTIEVELSKEGADQVSIRVAYYSGNTKDPKGYEISLKQRLERTIGRR